MKVANLVGSRFKEKPSDCVIDSHALMVRGGYMKYVGNGIYSEFPTLRRVTSKGLRTLSVRRWMLLTDQEVLFPVVLPADYGMNPDVTKVLAASCCVLQTAMMHEWYWE